MTNEEIITATLEELAKEPDWQIRYAKYADDILKNQDHYIKMSHKANISFPLSAYTTITKMKSSGCEYDIRYLGESIGTLSIKQDGERKFKYSKGYTDLQQKRGYDNLPNLDDEEKWDSDNMTLCRSILKSTNVHEAKTHSPEHKCENLLLREFSKNKSEEKSLLHIQPVKFGGKFVQFTTNLSASHKNEVSYSKKGGGIDILARAGVGANSHLCVFELKDENHKSESMEVVLQQALSYAVFLAQLLDNTNSKNWWKVLGYKGDTEPKHVIDVVGLMPKGTESRCKEEYQVGTFTLRMRTMYFDKDALYKQEKFEFSGSFINELNNHNH